MTRTTPKIGKLHRGELSEGEVSLQRQEIRKKDDANGVQKSEKETNNRGKR